MNFMCFRRYVGIIQRDAEPSQNPPMSFPTLDQLPPPVLFKACMWGEKFATIYLCLRKVPLKFMSSHKQEGVETAAAALHNVPWCWCYVPTNWYAGIHMSHEARANRDNHLHFSSSWSKVLGRIHLPHLRIHENFMDDSSINFHD